MAGASRVFIVGCAKTSGAAYRGTARGPSAEETLQQQNETGDDADGQPGPGGDDHQSISAGQPRRCWTKSVGSLGHRDRNEE